VRHNFAVTRVFIAVTLALAVTAIGVGATAEASKRTARLQLADQKPLKLRGVGFLAGEKVRVRVVAGSARTSNVDASRAGRFVAGFPTMIPFDRCSALFAEAVGARGSRARLKLPQPLCPPG
jgi:hypothetical protein